MDRERSTKRILDDWIENDLPNDPGEIKAEALMLAWHHWHDLSQMTIDQFGKIGFGPVSYGGVNCSGCRVYKPWADKDACQDCFFNLIGPYCEDEPECCGGTWRMFDSTWTTWRSGKSDVEDFMWEIILQTAAQDVRNFIGWIIQN